MGHAHLRHHACEGPEAEHVQRHAHQVLQGGDGCQPAPRPHAPRGPGTGLTGITGAAHTPGDRDRGDRSDGLHAPGGQGQNWLKRGPHTRSVLGHGAGSWACLQRTHLVEESRGKEHPGSGQPLAAAPAKHGLVEVSAEGGGRGPGAGGRGWAGLHSCPRPPPPPPLARAHLRHHLCTGMFQFCQK